MKIMCRAWDGMAGPQKRPFKGVDHLLVEIDEALAKIMLAAYLGLRLHEEREIPGLDRRLTWFMGRPDGAAAARTPTGDPAPTLWYPPHWCEVSERFVPPPSLIRRYPRVVLRRVGQGICFVALHGLSGMPSYRFGEAVLARICPAGVGMGFREARKILQDTRLVDESVTPILLIEDQTINYGDGFTVQFPRKDGWFRLEVSRRRPALLLELTKEGGVLRKVQITADIEGLFRHYLDRDLRVP